MFPLIGIGFERIRRLTYAKPTQTHSIHAKSNLNSCQTCGELGFLWVFTSYQIKRL